MAIPQKSCTVWLAGALLGLAISALPGFARQRDQKEKDAPRTITLPAEALKFGDALLAQASPAFLKWARGYAEKAMYEQLIEPRAAMALVDQRYKGTSDDARDCGIFLLFHLAYQDQAARTSLLEGEIREIDRETYDITRQLQVMYEAEQNRMGSTRGALSAGERVAQQDQIDRKNARLRDLREKKIELGKKVEKLRKKVNYYLKVAAVTHERMKGIDPAAIQVLTW